MNKRGGEQGSTTQTAGAQAGKLVKNRGKDRQKDKEPRKHGGRIRPGRLNVKTGPEQGKVKLRLEPDRCALEGIYPL